MFGLQRTITDYQTACQSDEVDRDELDKFAHEVIIAVRAHVNDSHITITYADGSIGRRKPRWDADEQRFIDWGNNFWLYGPKSFRGERAGGKWVLDARHPDDVLVKAILERAAHVSKLDRVDQLWNLYWQLLLQDAMHYNEHDIVDLHIKPLDVTTLDLKPDYTLARRSDRVPDMILV